MLKVKVNIYNRQEIMKIPRGLKLLIRRCCSAVLKDEGIDFFSEVDVTFIDNEQIRELNKEYRNKDISTDVLSFPLGENGVYDKNKETGAAMIGDIVISLEKAQRQSEIYGHSFAREIGFLVVHSMLHLLGYDHEDVDGLSARNMREREEKILLDLGLSKNTAYLVFKNEEKMRKRKKKKTQRELEKARLTEQNEENKKKIYGKSAKQ